MALNGPILIIDDDANDTEVVVAALKEIGAKNELKTFASAPEALEYLTVTTDKPLVILCDVRMPGMDGLGFLKTIARTEYLRKKVIPFIFFTEIASPEIVDEAYDIGVQGFYKKAGSYDTVKEQLYSILLYWSRCLHPNSG